MKIEEETFTIVWRIMFIFMLLFILLALYDIKDAIGAEPTSAVIDITELDCSADTVSFTDMVDLIRKTNSVIAVKDTTESRMWVRKQYVDSLGSKWDIEEFNIMGVNWEWIYQEYGILKFEDIRLSVRHRRLVGVTVTSDPDSIGSVEERYFNDAIYWLGKYDPAELYRLWETDPRYGTGYWIEKSNTKPIPGTAVVWFEWEVK